MKGKFPAELESNIDKAINHLINKKKVNGISGDCGFMMYYQNHIRNHPLTHVPVFMSALAQLPAVACAYGPEEIIIVLTAEAASLLPMAPLINQECGLTVTD
jgi:hypothetical protein